MAEETRLDSCGCCESSEAPPSHENPPRQDVLRYRIGTHGEFLRRMLARVGAYRLPDGAHANSRPLARLATRDTSDPAIAMLDAWAAVGDVLTFYQERIANECYLSTATERESVLELARAIGYELSPGVAASTIVQFTVESAAGAPQKAQVEVGVRIKSVPGAGQLPQTFETIEAGEVRAEWNGMLPKQTEPQIIAGKSQLFARGASLRVDPGSMLLFTNASGSQFERAPVTKVEMLADKDQTRILWGGPLPGGWSPKPFAMRQRAAWFGHNATDWKSVPLEIKKAYYPAYDPDDPNNRPSEWPGYALPSSSSTIDLDAEYSGIVQGSWLLITGGAQPRLAKISGFGSVSLNDFQLGLRVTRLWLESPVDLTGYGRRTIRIWFGSEEIPLAETPIAGWLTGEQIELASRITHPPKGRSVILRGKRKRARIDAGAIYLKTADGLLSTTVDTKEGFTLLGVPEPRPEEGAGLYRYHLRAGNGVEGYSKLLAGMVQYLEPREGDEYVCEAATLFSATDAPGGPTTLQLDDPFMGVYERSTVTLSANALQATHGETAREALGSGDGSQANQQFTLRKAPLTYVSAATPSGSRSTLVVRVNGVEWSNVASLYGQPADAPCYEVRQERDGSSTVVFGDGICGARLPTGVENVTAEYRVGLGPDGEVGAGKLSLLETRPYGVKSTANPIAASGAAAPEELSLARRNAPMKVLTLERVVSLADYEDFARAFAGVGKARVDVVWSKGCRQIVLTIGTASGEPAAQDSKLVDSLTKAIAAQRAGRTPVVIAGYRKAYFRVDLNVILDERYVAEDVKAAIRTKLAAEFSFAKRAFAQVVTSAEISAMLGAIEGVLGVDINKLYRMDDPSGPLQTLAPALLAASAAVAEPLTAGAELLLLDPGAGGIALQEVS